MNKFNEWLKDYALTAIEFGLKTLSVILGVTWSILFMLSVIYLFIILKGIETEQWIVYASPIFTVFTILCIIELKRIEKQEEKW